MYIEREVRTMEWMILAAIVGSAMGALIAYSIMFIINTIIFIINKLKK